MSDAATSVGATRTGLTASRSGLAIFDLDGTLTRGNTFVPYLATFAARTGRRRLLALFALWLPAYGARLIRDNELKQRLLTSFFGGVDVETVREHTEWFCKAWLPDRLHPVGLSHLRRHQELRRRTVLLSASPDLYVPAIAAALGIHETICTRVTRRNGCYDGAIDGENCKGLAKLRRLQEFLAVDAAPPDSYAYGDSRHDLPVLAWVEHGFLIRGRRTIAMSPATKVQP